MLYMRGGVKSLPFIFLILCLQAAMSKRKIIHLKKAFFFSFSWTLFLVKSTCATQSSQSQRCSRRDGRGGGRNYTQKTYQTTVTVYDDTHFTFNPCQKERLAVRINASFLLVAHSLISLKLGTNFGTKCCSSRLFSDTPKIICNQKHCKRKMFQDCAERRSYCRTFLLVRPFALAERENRTSHSWENSVYSSNDAFILPGIDCTYMNCFEIKASYCEKNQLQNVLCLWKISRNLINNMYRRGS